MASAFEAHLTGSAREAMRSFYALLPSVPRASWPAMMHGMGHNFEFYDALFALVVAHVQLSFGEGDYTPRHEAMQAALLPFCSEFGIEPHHDLGRSHRRLYADFFETATATRMPERYPLGDHNPWLDTSRRWADRMRGRLDRGPGDSVPRARYALGYLWTVEHLSVFEFDSMRDAWHRLGVHAPYLDAHCAVEETHDADATRAVLAFCGESDPLVIEAIRAHEEDLGGYYRDLTSLAGSDDGGRHA